MMLKNIPLERVNALYRRKDAKAMAFLEAYARAKKAARSVHLPVPHSFEREKATSLAAKPRKHSAKRYSFPPMKRAVKRIETNRKAI